MSLSAQTAVFIILALALTGAPFWYFWPRTHGKYFQMDPDGEKGAFLPILDNYLRLADGLGVLVAATLGYIASPILFHQFVPDSTGHLGSLALLDAWAPLMASLACVFLFRTFLVIWYETYRHNKESYSRLRYVVIKSLPASACINAAFGYLVIFAEVLLWIHRGGGQPPPPQQFF